MPSAQHDRDDENVIKSIRCVIQTNNTVTRTEMKKKGFQNYICICLTFRNDIEVGFQSNLMQVNTNF